MVEIEEKYNYFFNQIVKNQDDFVGSIAYVLYKRNKIEYIEQYKKEHDGKEPDLAVLREWQKGECVKSKLDNYKVIAEQKTTEFVNLLQRDKEKQYSKRKAELDTKETNLVKRERAVREQEKDLKKRNQYCHVKQKGQFWSGVVQSLLASFFFIVICFLIILFLSGKTDFIGWLTGVLGSK